jgi:hypothetical protein
LIINRFGASRARSKLTNRFSAASVTNANGLDPKIALGPTGSNECLGFDDEPCTQSNCFVPDGFCTVQLDSTGSGVVDILNDTGFNIISDTINVDTNFQQPLFCDPVNSFGFNNVTEGGDLSSCTYAFNSDPPGIGGGLYAIHFGTFTDLNGVPLTSLTFDLRWINGTTPTTTPEPGTILLLGTGWAAFVAGRKKLKGAGCVV